MDIIRTYEFEGRSEINLNTPKYAVSAKNEDAPETIMLMVINRGTDGISTMESRNSKTKQITVPIEDEMTRENGDISVWRYEETKSMKNLTETKVMMR